MMMMMMISNRSSPVLVELGGHLFAQPMYQTRHSFFAVAGRHGFQFLVQRLDDVLLVCQSLLEVADSLLVHVGVERDLVEQLRLAIFGVETQAAFTLASTFDTVKTGFH